MPRPAYFTVKRSVAGGMVASRVLVVASPLSLLPAMSRFFVFVPALFVALVSHSPAAPLEYFRPEQVRLLPGPFLHAQDLLIEQLLAHDVDRFLAPFRSEAGLEPKAPKYPNWESSGLDGHTAGHYLTALAQLSASTGHPEITRRLDVMLAEFAEVQRANGDGYIGGVPGGREMWAKIGQGDISADSFGLNGGWVPWYNLHKTFAGLRNAWLLAGREDARDMFLRLCDWCERLVEPLSDEQMEIMLRTEHGGMAEVLADAYAISGDERYLRLAKRFSHRAILGPLLQKEDRLSGLHANTQIPKVTGFARIGELADEPRWVEAARFFWDTVVHRRSVSIGGNSVREHFHELDGFERMIESREGPETCNTYNMLRLTEQLFRLDPDPEFADTYERAVFNHILSTQHPVHGGFVYFTPMRPRDYRVYSQAGQCFWCCVGTGMENHGRYGRFIYARAADDLYVNLFMASELDWSERGLRVRQETGFPDTSNTTLRISLREPQRFALRIRWPEWVRVGEFGLRVNGQPEVVRGGPSSYVVLEREWRDGDTVELDLPMHTVIDPLPDETPYVAFRHGPIVLAARTGTESLDGLIAGDGRMAHIGTGPLLPLDGAPMLVGTEDELLGALRPVEGKPLTFTAADAIRPDTFDQLRLEPFFRIHDARYVIYWRHTTPEAYPQLVREIEARERERLALEARTLDVVTPGEQQPEVEHGYEGEQSATGVTLGRSWRNARGWFAYRMKGVAGEPMQLRFTTWDGQWGEQRFDLIVNGRIVSEVEIRPGGTDRFVDHVYPVPSDAVGADGVLEVKFAAKDGSTAGAIYEVRLLK